MRGQVHHHADIANPLREWPLAARRDLEHRPQLALREPRPKRAQRRVVPLDMSHAADKAAFLECLGKQPSALRVGGQRFLDQRMHSGSGEPEPDISVRQRGRGDHAHVDAEREQCVQVGR